MFVKVKLSGAVFFSPNIKLTLNGCCSFVLHALLLHSHIIIFYVIRLLLLMQHTFSAKCSHMFCIFIFLKKKFKILLEFSRCTEYLLLLLRMLVKLLLEELVKNPPCPWLIRHSFKPIIVTAVLQKMSEPSCKKYGEQIPARNIYTSNLFHPKESFNFCEKLWT